ncbi:hypothetical protein HYALB_00007522 [Hymenoscyphus albidus]|uniref:Uncharacterized protein n=1 Tax=Hymenoscyphus albidus TaxID=595503 RepID=A0A9N9LWA5_9HELO|nr:hypothetical protein HYALB_00007522 [Hymenoscyphus albidus]
MKCPWRTERKLGRKQVCIACQGNAESSSFSEGKTELRARKVSLETLEGKNIETRVSRSRGVSLEALEALEGKIEMSVLIERDAALAALEGNETIQEPLETRQNPIGKSPAQNPQLKY